MGTVKAIPKRLGAGVKAWKFIQRYDDIGAQRLLAVNTCLWTQKCHAAIPIGAEEDSFLRNFFDQRWAFPPFCTSRTLDLKKGFMVIGQREDLKSTRVCNNRALPT